MHSRRYAVCLTQTQPTYIRHSSRGGFVTIVLGLAMVVMIWVELSAYLHGEHDVTFEVDSHISKLLQINMDITVATPCSSMSNHAYTRIVGGSARRERRGYPL